MPEQLVTQEVGSLAKPNWRVRAIAGRELGQSDINEAERWGRRLEIDTQGAAELLILARQGLSQGSLDPELIQQIRDLAALYAIRLQERAGLDVVYDGEQDRPEMYQHAIEHSKGFEPRGSVRSFDNKYYRRAAVVDTPSVRVPWHTAELIRLQRLTDRRIKVPITGAYTIAAWSYDEHYARGAKLGTKEAMQGAKEAREQFVLDIARHLIRPNIEELLALGAHWIQIDEPAATTVPDEVPLFVQAFNESVRGLEGEFSVHICFSDYSRLFPHIQSMENCSQYSLEFANRDSRELGVGEEERPGYEILRQFREHEIPSRIGLGVVEVHDDFIEPPKLVRDRILYASSVLGNPALVNPSSDCGLRTRTWDVAFDKLTNMVQGARLAEQLL